MLTFKTVYPLTPAKTAQIAGAKAAGFTLIELMIAVAIVAILAGIALPSYQNYVKRSIIRTMQADMVALSLALENRYQRTLSYPTHDNIDEKTGTLTISTAYSSWKPATKLSDYEFKLKSGAAAFKNAANVDVKGYVITATPPTGSRIDTNCVLVLRSDNTKTLGKADAPCPHSPGIDWL